MIATTPGRDHVCYAGGVGRTALYRDPVEFRPARAEVYLEGDAVALAMPDGRTRRFALDGCTASAVDGFVIERNLHRVRRRFVRMLVLERAHERHVLITPPDEGAVAPNVVSMPGSVRFRTSPKTALSLVGSSAVLNIPLEKPS